MDAACPLCGAPLNPEQEWCLHCGAAARTRLAAPTNWKAPIVALAATIVLALGVLTAALVKLSGGSATATVPAPVTTTITTPAATTLPTTSATTSTGLGATTAPTTTTTPGATPGTHPSVNKKSTEEALHKAGSLPRTKFLPRTKK